MGKIILTGDRPTGRLHVGHYVGSLKRRVELQNSGQFDEIYIMIADAQALTDNADNPEKVRQNIMNVALDYLACGIDPEKCHIFIQSMVPELTELTFYYMNLVTVSRVQRNPTVKAEIQQRNFEASIPVGFFCYPISQAADITAFRATTVPVGEDQMPMIEQCKEIVHKFNSVYGETLTEPEVLKKRKEYLRFGDQLYLLPPQMVSLKGLKVLRPGLHIGTIKKNRFEPSHALALWLFPEDAKVQKEVEPDGTEAVKYLKGETLTGDTGMSAPCEKGWVLICTGNVSLGWGKMAAGTIKNHYPKGLRWM